MHSFRLSGPSILDISRHYIAAERDDPGSRLVINWLPERTAESLDRELAALGPQASRVTSGECSPIVSRRRCVPPPAWIPKLAATTFADRIERRSPSPSRGWTCRDGKPRFDYAEATAAASRSARSVSIRWSRGCVRSLSVRRDLRCRRADRRVQFPVGVGERVRRGVSAARQG